MAKQSLTGTVRSTALEKSLGATIVNRFFKKVDSIYSSHLGDPEQNFVTPVLDTLLEELPQMRSKLIDLYNGTFGTHKLVNDIPDDIKAVQGALLDGLVFGFDPSTESMEIYTMNAKLLFGMDAPVTFIDDKVVDKNSKGEYKGFRIDITYRDGSDSFEFKAVNHRKVLNEDIIFVPYLSIARGMKLVESYLSGGSVLKLVQHVAGVEKVRAVTQNKKLLAEFCDDPSAVEFTGCQYFPLKAMFYVPVIGAPSTTAMVTKVNIVNLDYISKLANRAQLKSLGVFKPTNALRIMIGENTVIQVLDRVSKESPDEYSALLDKFPRNDEIFDGGTKDGSEVSPVMLSKYMHQLSEKELEQVFDTVPGVKEEMGKKQFLMDNFEVKFKIDKEPIDPVELRRLIKGHICKILCRKDDCSTYTVLGTNNFKLLSKLYGKDYFGKYESLGSRLGACVDEIRMGRPMKEACSEYCLDLDIIEEVSLKVNIRDITKYDELKKEYAALAGIKTRSSSSGGSGIMIRQCFATRTTNGEVSDYYRTVNPEKVLQVAILSED